MGSVSSYLSTSVSCVMALGLGCHPGSSCRLFLDFGNLVSSGGRGLQDALPGV